jgi:hypothetical protein
MPESRAEYYRRMAAESRKAADTFGAGTSLRDAYLQAERAWLELADQAERNEDLAQQQQQQQQQQQGTEPEDDDNKE